MLPNLLKWVVMSLSLARIGDPNSLLFSCCMSNVNENELHTAYETHTGGVGSLDKAWILEVNFLGFSKIRYKC